MSTLTNDLLGILPTDEEKKAFRHTQRLIQRMRLSMKAKEVPKSVIAELLDVNDQVHFLGKWDSCVTLTRRLIKTGPAMIQVESRDESAVCAKSKFIVFLMNDTIVCSKKNKLLQRESGKIHPQRREKKLREIYHISMRQLNLLELPDNEENRLTIKFVESSSKDIEKKFSIFCGSKEEKQEWIYAINQGIEFVNQRKVIGVAFELLMASEREEGNLVPSLVEQCTSSLVSTGALKKEGLIRVSANNSDMLDLTNKINEGLEVSMTELDSYLVVCLLKKFFRDMPECIFTSPLYEKLIKLSGRPFHSSSFSIY